eukprot:m.9047 g.9047  ORF g.9047 m.9047 type:complete len:902 (+) comp21043_c0_seq2:131-2836(+)
MAGIPVRGLNTPYDGFPTGLLKDLGLLLDKEDELAGRDWRVLVKVLNLPNSEVEIVRKQQYKTKSTLQLWSVAEPMANGRLLVSALLEMRHNKAACIVQYYLGEQYDEGSRPARELMDELDRMAHYGEIQSLKDCLQKFGKERGETSVEDMFASWLYTPLHSAARYGHLPAVVLLIESGFNPQRENSSEETAEVIATKNNHPHVADYLQGLNGTDIPWAEVNPSRSRVDRLVARREMQELEGVLESGANPNEVVRQDWNPLHTAAARGDMKAVKILLKYNAHITARDADGFTPEDWANRNHHEEVAALLREKRIDLERREAPDQDLLNMTITISSEHPEDDPVEFPIVCLDLKESLKEISVMMNRRVNQLVSKANPAVVILNMNQLKEIREVIAMTGDDQRSPTPPSYAQPKSMNLLEEGPVHGPEFPAVLVHSIDNYWDIPFSFRFKPYEDWALILRQVSQALGREIVNLYTWDKLSRITTGRILAGKGRIVAATKGTNMPAKRQLLDPQFIGSETVKEVTAAGGSIFVRDHAIIVTIPEKAVADGDKVTVRVCVSLPCFRFDMDHDEWMSLLPAGHPVHIDTTPRGYEFQRPVRVRIAHCGDIEANRDDASIAVLTSSIQDEHGSIHKFHRLPQDTLDTATGYVWMNVRQLSAWFWPFVNSGVAYRLCTVAIYSHSDREIVDRNESKFKIFLMPGINFYLTESGAFIDNDFAYRGAMNFTFPYGRELDVGVSHQHENWMVNPESQRMAFKRFWDMLFEYNRDRNPFRCITYTLTWTGNPDEMNSSCLLLKFDFNHSDDKNGYFLECCANLSGQRMTGPFSPQCKEEISQTIDACHDAERGCRGLAKILRVDLQDEPPVTALSVLDAFEQRKGGRQELRLALNHLHQEEAVAVLDKVYGE